MTKPEPTTEAPEEAPAAPITSGGKHVLEQKYGPKVASHNYTILPNLLFEVQARLGITPTQFNVLLHIVQHWWKANDPPFPKIETLARRLGKSERMVQRYLDGLEKAKLIKRVHRFKGRKKQISSAYRLDGLVTKLVELEPDIRKAKTFRDKRLKAAEAA